MVQAVVRSAVVCAVVLAALVTVAQERQLTFAERVAAQEAIERVYYSHQVGADRPFEEAVPRDLLERKVVNYLKQSAALEKIWNTPITAEMLERELQRMSRGTRMSDRLRELFAALDDDPVLIQECLARATLADRMSRSFYSLDPRFHAAARREADELHEALANGTLSPRKEHARRWEIELARESDELRSAQPPAGPRSLALSPAQFDGWRSRLPEAAGEISVVGEDRDGFYIRTLLEEDGAKLRVAAYRVAKTSWDTWWSKVSPGLDEHEVVTVASPDASIPDEVGNADQVWSPTGQGTAGAPAAAGFPCSPDDTWDNGTLENPPDPRYRHTAVWTGNVMLVWGGLYGSALNTGGRYDPATDSWTKMSTTDAPTPRYQHSAVWTGAEMIVWGGGFGYSNTGGRYDPSTDSWTATSTTDAPSPRTQHEAVWTGDLMLVWGGYGAGTVYTPLGGRYDPATDSWTAMSTVGVPSARREHSALWTGSEMLVWGGRLGNYPYKDTGGRYDPSTDSWTATSMTDAPEGRCLHTAVWTGSEMLVWGGYNGGGLKTGGRYDPATDTWTATSTTGAPLNRRIHTAVWTGEVLIVWGGLGGYGTNGSVVNTGGQYDPSTDSWTATSTADAPWSREDHTAVWTGDRMLVWGGDSWESSTNTGGRYDPSTDSWTATSIGGGPLIRTEHTAVWTGNLMVIWGGYHGGWMNTGGRYDPWTDSWTATSMIGAPTGRHIHSAIWTGDRMVVWGGYDGFYANSGGRYDPVADSWTATSTDGAPALRELHTAVWTGDLMVVWGGDTIDGFLGTGGRYDPVADSWAATSTVDAPVGRWYHTAVWLDDRMVVWGGNSGYDGESIDFNTGGRYDPVADTWYGITTNGAPAARYRHTAVVADGNMIVWGGYGGDYLKTGGVYHPGDSWTATSTTGAPSGRHSHTAVWTGDVMVVWGGNGPGSSMAGGRYDRVYDDWEATSTDDAPQGRSGHTAVWTGSYMLIWGGFPSGGRYALGHASDDDWDFFTECQGDCDDTNQWISPDADEVNDGIDNHCPGYEGYGSIDEIEGEAGFVDPGNPLAYSWQAQPLATLYEVARFEEAGSPASCTLTTTADTWWVDPEEPATGLIFHYLVRALEPHAGSWGQDSAGVDRGWVCP